MICTCCTVRWPRSRVECGVSGVIFPRLSGTGGGYDGVMTPPLKPSPTESPLLFEVDGEPLEGSHPCDDVAAHHLPLVLRVNGKLHGRWQALQDRGSPGPYLISHPFFKPSFKVLSHEDEPQIPHGVVRIESRRESAGYGAIQPKGLWPANSQGEPGYPSARQYCFRCHNMRAQDGTKAGRSWLQLAARAAKNAQRFRHTIHNPRSIDPAATMPAHSGYDDATLDAVTACFATFHQAGRKP